jgi:hypothetical protein
MVVAAKTERIPRRLKPIPLDDDMIVLSRDLPLFATIPATYPQVQSGYAT